MTDSILEITTVVGCQRGCDYCPQRTLVSAYRGPRTMEWGTYTHCLSKVPQDVEISFAGFAEPWQNPRCTNMVTEAFGQGHRVSVFTTAVGMSAHDVHAIKHIPFHHFCLHLPDQAGRMTWKPNDVYVETVAALKASIPNLTFMCVGDLHPHLRQLFDPMDWTGSLNSRAGNLEIMNLPRQSGPLFCTASPELCHNVLLPDGTVTLCCMDYGVEHPLGNLMEQSYQSLFLREEYEKVRDLMSSEDQEVICRHCYAAGRVK